MITKAWVAMAFLLTWLSGNLFSLSVIFRRRNRAESIGAAFVALLCLFEAAFAWVIA